MAQASQLKEDLAPIIEGAIKAFVRDTPLNRLALDGGPIYGEPLVGFAQGDDPLFQEYKHIIGDFYLTPRQVMEKALAHTSQPDPRGDGLGVVCWVLPMSEQTRRSNRKQKEAPSQRWAHSRAYGEQLNEALRREVEGMLQKMGYPAVAPTLSPFFERQELGNGPASNWSERHTLYAAGLGTFSLTDALITPKGMAHRCGSVVVGAEVPVTPRPYSGPYANCPFFIDRSCQACIARCPAGALSPQGHNKFLCRDYLRSLTARLKESYQVNTETGCGLCQTAVPCESRIPKKAAAASAGITA